MSPVATPAPDANRILMFGIHGRDGSTPKFRLTDDACVEALNVDWFESSLGRKRGGAAAIGITGGTGQAVVSTLMEFVPTFDQSGRELWSIDDAATPVWKRLAGGTAWADVTVGDACQSEPWNINGVTFNRKLFVAYNSPINRLHVWDGTVFRPCGIAPATVPTAANGGAGGTVTVLRYYKIRWVKIVSGVVTLAGELSPSVSITPDGAHANVTVTQSTPPGEVETHWEVYGSPDDADYFRQAQVLKATTTYADTVLLPTSYTGNVPPDVNSFLVPPSAKYLVPDKKRLVMGGAWETTAGISMTPKNNRVWWTAPLGATDNGDDERVENTSTIKNYSDIEEDLTGLGGPINGSVLAFSYGGVWKFVNTPVDSAPYIVIRIAGSQGCIDHKSVVLAEDEDGEACAYWLSPVGPVRMGAGGYQRCHEDVDDIWRTVNLSAAKRVGHGVFHRDIHQIWWWVATGSSDEPDTRIVFDTRLGKMIDSGVDKSLRKGWAKHTGPSCAARCSAMMSSTIGATMSRTLKPHIGVTAGSGAIWKCDTGTTDNGTAFQSYIESRPFMPWGLGNFGGMPEEAVLAAAAASGVSIRLTCIRDMGIESLTFDLDLTPEASETHIMRQFDASRFAQARSIKFRVGDATAVDAAWNLDAIIAGTVSEEGSI